METAGTPRLLVIGGYRLGFDLASSGEQADLRVFIGYDLPSSPGQRLLGRILGPVYAKWCVRQMVRTSVPRGACNGAGRVRQGFQCPSLPRGTANWRASFDETYEAIKCQCQGL